MSNPALVRAAARANAEWCHAFCSTHGIAGRFDPGLWSSPVRTPPHYPDAVTLCANVGVRRIVSEIEPGAGCSVKDSFACLDLEAEGFETLFQAEWIAREPAMRPRTLSDSGQWSVLTSEAQLREWETSYVGLPGDAAFFRPTLLTNGAIAVLGRHESDRIVAGAIAIRSTNVIGLSCVFAAVGELDSAWSDAANVAANLWGEMPTLSYDTGGALDAARNAAFESIGELIVWLRGTY